ncbi:MULTISPECIES: efflux RND transporter permease subunit [Chromobacterium]|uniref:efflux RND transporter permease subunit n=1 Tax=Chromobacterium TaxID=535 RepID=UPI0005BD99B4|nr:MULTISPECIES: multidrug efflux RND transporter permease subunit [Chromobacterium]QOZ84783.1 multidrug efflux RND transporter permease subunit [Chromobacterium sp. Rain0013]WON84973.1 multidrug efflux RND transporter permease subunit [Chromobacterium haemolyticum]
MFSRFFINRPIFASVLSIVVVLAGLAAMRALPVEQYPQIVPAVVSVSANYPGATPETIAQTVAAPLEQQLNGVENMLYMQSSAASNGQLSLNVYFAVGTDPDQATIDVNNRVQAAMKQLPDEVQRQGVTVRKKSTSVLSVISIGSPTGQYDRNYLSNFALLNVMDELKRIPGVGDVAMMGGTDYAMRLWLRPDRMAQLGLTPSDVAKAVREQNAQFAAGKIGAQPTSAPISFTYTVNAKGRLSEPKEFENIIVRSMPDGSKIRVKDVARVEMGGNDYDVLGTRNGKPSVGITTYLQPSANALKVSAAIAAKMEELKARFPAGVDYTIPFDTTKFVKVSIHGVVETLLEATVLVFLVVYLFLQNFRATLIPCIAVPVSLIGTFAGMLLLGFSINLLTLFGMVLAIGIVVDDAIVVLENVERIMSERRCSAKEAAVLAMGEVSGALVAIVLVLCAVFLPVAFMGGMTGVMYKQFAVTIAMSVIISGIVALTLTPALCALLLKPGHHQPPRFFQWFNRAFERLTGRYVLGVLFLNRRVGVAFGLIAVILAATVGLYQKVPGSLVPNEDMGTLFASTALPDAAALTRTAKATAEFDRLMMANPNVESVTTFTGFDILSGSKQTNRGTSFVTLKDWDQRKAKGEDSFSVSAEFNRLGRTVQTGVMSAFNPAPIIGMSTTGGLEAYLQDRGDHGAQKLSQAAEKLLAAARQRPEFASVTTTFRANVPQKYLDLDREKTKALGVDINQVFDTLQATFGQLYVNDFNKFGRTYKVQLQSEADFRARPEDIANIYVRSTEGVMVPLSSLVEVKSSYGPELVDRFNIFNAAKILAQPAPGVSSGQAIQALEEVTRQVLGNDYALAWSGSAYQEKLAGGTAATAFLFGILMVFLILAAQYERWSLPLAVVTSVPFALFGALLAAVIGHQDNNVYFQIGVVTLVGLAAKNAILIVEFAVQQRQQGLPLMDAALEAARLRFRPIVMTSMAFILGCVPLVISSGAGSASRRALGTPVVGGMLAATFIATFFVPMFFRLIMQASERRKKPVAAEEADHV